MNSLKTFCIISLTCTLTFLSSCEFGNFLIDRFKECSGTEINEVCWWKNPEIYPDGLSWIGHVSHTDSRFIFKLECTLWEVCAGSAVNIQTRVVYRGALEGTGLTQDDISADSKVYVFEEGGDLENIYFDKDLTITKNDQLSEESEKPVYDHISTLFLIDEVPKDIALATVQLELEISFPYDAEDDPPVDVLQYYFLDIIDELNITIDGES